MKYITVARTLVAAAALSVSLSVGAQAPGGFHPGFGDGFGGNRPPMERAFGSLGEPKGRFWNNPTVIDRLKLTDDQRKSMDDILLKHRSTLIDLHANLEKAELALEPLIHEDQPNEARILAQIDTVAQARAELEKANARFLLAIRAKLTPDQWKSLRALRDEHMQHMHNGDRPGGMHEGPLMPPSGGDSGNTPQ